MHACGHDGHTAILVGAARVLNELREHLPVTVRFVFQPGEEVECGGKTLVNLGCCDNAEAAFALHGWPGLPTGQISSRPGALFAQLLSSPYASREGCTALHLKRA